MLTWMLWHGGSSYAQSSVDDAKAFDSMAEAIGAFRYRFERNDSYYPCVDESSTAQLFFADPRTTDDPYPDRVLSIGPRCGVVAEA